MERWRDGGTERQREEEIDGEYGMTSVAPFPRRSFSLSLRPSVSPSLLPRVSVAKPFALQTNWPRRTIRGQNQSHPRTDKYGYASQTIGACHRPDLWRSPCLQFTQVVVFGVSRIAG